MNIAEKWNAYKAWKKAKIEELHEKHPKVADALVKTQAVAAVGLNDKILAIEFGNPENPLAVAAFYDKPHRYGISIHRVLDDTGLKNGDIVPEDKVGDADFYLLFRTKTSVQTIIEELQWIEHAVEINEGENIMQKTRYEQFKEMTLQDMAVTLSYCFDCSSCPAKKDGCYENDTMCIDAIADWLNQSGNF